MPVFTAIGAALGGISAAAAAVGTVGVVAGVGGVVAANKSAQAAKAATQSAQQVVETQKQMQVVQENRQRRAAIRSTIIARAQAAAQAQAYGVSDTSMVAGGLGSISSQLGANLGYGSQMSGLGMRASDFQMAQIGFQGQSDLYSTYSGALFGASKLAFGSSYGKQFTASIFA